MTCDKLNICGLFVNNISYEETLDFIYFAVAAGEKKLITYTNANTVNYLYRNADLIALLKEFDLVHPDGIGIYTASKILYGINGFKNRFTGSDLYTQLITLAQDKNYRLFFFGHDNRTLEKVKHEHPGLNICGYSEGYNYNNDDVLNKINTASPDILIIGLSFPKQEKWIVKYRNSLNFKVCLCVGEGIKVFSGTKIRGPKILRLLGLEWLVRLISNPSKYFIRYVIGNPLFLYRIIMTKIRKFRG